MMIAVALVFGGSALVVGAAFALCVLSPSVRHAMIGDYRGWTPDN